MLAARDQENRIHGQQAAGAAKATNLRQLAPKTPGAKAPKTPFKVPLNDENNSTAFAGKQTIKPGGRGNENALLGGKKTSSSQDAFKTPMTSRAPLGQKTTNAKARAHLALPSLPDASDLAKSRQRSASARKRGRRISHAQPVKIDVLVDDGGDAPDIGETHPRPRDLDDFAGELPDLDLSALRAPQLRHILRDEPALDGLSLAQLRAAQDAEDRRVRAAVADAACRRDAELSLPEPCTHRDECPGECALETARRRRVQDECARDIARVRASWSVIDRFRYPVQAKPPPKQPARAAPAGARVPKSTVLQPKTASTRPAAPPAAGPPAALARSAAACLATQPPRPAAPPAAKSRYPPGLARTWQREGARAVSNSTLGYAKGRAASAHMRGTVLPRAGRDVFAPPRPESSAEVDADTLEDALVDFELLMPEE